MTARAGRVLVAVLACGLALAGCRNVHGVPAVREALERDGFHDVAVSFRSGGGIDLVRVDATTDAGADDGRLQQGAAAVWSTLPFRFDRLRLSVRAGDGVADATYGYEQLTGLLGPRPPGLDRRQVGDEVVVSGLRLVVLLSVGALLSVGLVLTVGLFGVRNVRRRRSGSQTGSSPTGDDQGDWDGSFPGLVATSPISADEADGPDAIPS